MISRTTHLLFLALLLVYASRAVSGTWISLLNSKPGAALVSFKSTNSSSVSFVLSLPGFYVEEKSIQGKKYVVPSLENAYPVMSKGDPDIPKVTATLKVTVSGEDKPILISSKFIDYPGYLLAPSPGNISRSELLPLPVFSSTYSTDAFFPGKLIESSDPYIIRNSRNLAVQLYPFQYNPVTGVLRVYYEMEVQMTLSTGPGINQLTTPDLQIINFQELVHPALGPSEQHSVKSGVLPAEIGRMLVICPIEYQEAIRPLMEWKNQSGVATEVIDASRFSNAEQIKQFVSSYYYSNKNLSYLLLVGDAEKVPPYMYSHGASDNYYSYLSGDDHYPDILVGRFAGISVRDIEIQVKRTLLYEKDPGPDCDWLGKVTGIGSTMGPGDDGETDYQHVRNMLTALNNFTYTGINEFYDGSQGGSDADGNPETQSLMDNFNAGTGLILYTGHGSFSTWATGHITRSVISMINNKGRFPFIWSTACETGNFAGSSCLAEAWMNAATDKGEPLGAVAALMASATQTAYPPMEGQDEMIKQLVKAGQDSSARTFGGLSISGMYRMNDIYGDAGFPITDTWILFGDPSLHVRTSLPKKLEVKHNSWIGKGRTSFNLTSNALSGVACLSSHGRILGTAMISEGNAEISLNQPAGGDTILLTVTSFNCLPYQSDILLVNSPSVPVSYYPVNHSRRIPVHTRYSWDSGSNGLPDYYKFYLGSDNPPTNLVNGMEILDISLVPDLKLEYLKKYYWRIEAINSSGIATGKVQEFETIYGPDEDFELAPNSDSKWISGGSMGWSIDENVVFGGKKSCRSGNISNGEHSSLIYPCEVKDCDFVGFWFRTSTEAGNKLQFLIDDNLMGEWSGNIDWNYVYFDVDPGLHTIEWRYSRSNAGASVQDAAWLDDISLPVHPESELDAGLGGVVCESYAFVPGSRADNYTSITWSSDGDGVFNDGNLLNPEYNAGAKDLEKGEVLLTMIVKSFEGCPVKCSSTVIYPKALPELNLPSDTIATFNSPMVLDASKIVAESWLWLPGNETSPVITVDTLGLDRGCKTLTLQATNQYGCTIQKTIRVHFPGSEEVPSFTVYPNPCKDHFTVEPENGATELDNIMLYNSSGSLVWQESGNIAIVNHQEFNIPALPASTYFLVLTKGSGRSVKPLVIK